MKSFSVKILGKTYQNKGLELNELKLNLKQNNKATLLSLTKDVEILFSLHIHEETLLPIPILAGFNFSIRPNRRFICFFIFECAGISKNCGPWRNIDFSPGQ